MKQIMTCVLILSMFLLFSLPVIAENTSDIQKGETSDIVIEEKIESQKKKTTDVVIEEKTEAFDLDKYIEETKKKLENFDINEIKEKLKNEKTGHYSLLNYLDTMNDLMDSYGPGRSLMSIALIPKDSYFKHVTFRCPGDYQASGVYFSERDLNAYNSSQYEWSKQFEREQRVMTNEIEAYLYHYLKLNPRFEFANGLITLHTEFKHGGYMWEMAFPNYHFTDEMVYGSMAQKTVLDTRQLSMTALALEVVTPFGLILVGQLPEQFQGLTGLMYGGPLPPVGGFTGGFGLLYGKMMEGMVWDDHRKGSENFGWNYTEVQNAEGYKDDDDLTLYGIGCGGMTQAFGGNFVLGGGYVKMLGGMESRLLAGMDLGMVMGMAMYNRDTFKLSAITGTVFGTLMDMGEDTYIGGTVKNFSKIFDEAMVTMDFFQDKYRPPAFMDFPDMIKQDPVWLFATQASMEKDKFTPEACFIYAQGSDFGWTMPMVIPGVMQNNGNKTPQGWLKAYLLNEVEKKYFPLIGTIPMSMAHLGLGELSLFSTNMMAIKAGTSYRINKYFEIYGQALAAWRSSVEYYKKQYWDNYIVLRGFNTMEVYNNDDRYREIMVAAVFQHQNVDYAEPDIDNFLGTELNTKLTYHVREGLELSLIAAYFKAGGFYEDILTPKRYSAVIGKISDVTGEIAIVSEEEEILYGPYEGSLQFFDLTDAFTFQLMFDLKWD